MREIKFRAWDNKKKEWLLGYEYKSLGGFSLFGETVMLGEWSAVLDQFLFEKNGYKHDDLKVMQYTGIKDKNGKEIYEGDIVTKSYCTLCYPRNEQEILENMSSYVAKVEFGSLGFRLTNGDMLLVGSLNYIEGKYDDLEVIGNIYENPDLLKNKV